METFTFLSQKKINTVDAIVKSIFFYLLCDLRFITYRLDTKTEFYHSLHLYIGAKIFTVKKSTLNQLLRVSFFLRPLYIGQALTQCPEKFIISIQYHNDNFYIILFQLLFNSKIVLRLYSKLSWLNLISSNFLCFTFQFNNKKLNNAAQFLFLILKNLDVRPSTLIVYQSKIAIE